MCKEHEGCIRLLADANQLLEKNIKLFLSLCKPDTHKDIMAQLVEQQHLLETLLHANEERKFFSSLKLSFKDFLKNSDTLFQQYDKEKSDLGFSSQKILEEAKQKEKDLHFKEEILAKMFL